MESFKDRYRNADTWQEKVVAINLLHQFMMYQCEDKNRWTLRKTATYFEISLGKTCEAVLLGSNFDAVKHFDTRREALEFLRANNK